MPRAVVTMPIPRRMLVTMRRARGHEAVAVIDDVEVRLRSVADADAPVAVEDDDAGLRVYDGAFYVPVTHRHRRDAGAEIPGEFAERERRYLRQAIGIREAGAVFEAPQISLGNYKQLLDGVSKKRGIGREADIPIQEIHDDGRANQERLAAYAAANWLLVDGRMHRRVRAPHYVLGGFDQGGLYLNRGSHDINADGGDYGLGHDKFRIDRVEDAVAFAAAWERAGRGHGVPAPCGPYRILRPDLVAAASPPDTARATVPGYIGALLNNAAAGGIGHAGDADVREFLELRRMGREGIATDEEAHAAMGRLRALAAAIEAIPPADRSPDYQSFHACAARAVIVFARYDAIDRPRIAREIDGGDLGALAP